MRRASITMLAAVVALVSLVGLSSTARAAGDPDSGWWWSANSKPPIGADPTPVPVPGVDVTIQVPQPPSPVDDDQLQVSGSASGPTAVAAIYYQLDSSESDPAVTLKLDTAASQNLAGAVVQACKLADRFNPGGAQFWEDRPQSACEVSTVGKLSADGASMTFDVANMVGFGDLIFELRPGGGASGNAPTFTAVFEPPQEGVIATSVASQSDAPPPVAQTAPPLTSPPLPQPGGASGGIAAPPSVSDLARSATVNTVPAAATPTTLGAPVAVAGADTTAIDAEPIADTPSRPVLLALIILILCGVGIWYAALRPSDADFGPTGGMGRFVADRVGAPPPLR